ncbi:MAG: hypothetical protein OEV44_14045, partial [Spirochaetota bacterium]|nr:hypothetical protein [Spirochaetota bacterium]
MIKSLLNNKLIIVLILLIHTINYSNAKEAEKVEFYTNKEIASKTRLFSYPVKYKISEDTAKKTKIYYKIYKSVSNMVVREDFYYNNVLISHYMFYYKDKLTDKEEYYDNLILVEYRKFIYNTKGKIERIESYDPKNFRSGDWYYFDAKNNIEKIARYRDNKLSFLKLFEKSKLSETHYYNRLFTKITKYNTKGVAISEKNINKDEENKITVKEDLNPLLSFKVEDINKIVFHSNKNNITLTKKRGKWTLKLDKT